MCRLFSFFVLTRLNIEKIIQYNFQTKRLAVKLLNVNVSYVFSYISLPHIISFFYNIYSGRANPKKCFCLLDRLWRIICWLGETIRDGFDRCLNYYKEMVLALFSAIMSLKMQTQWSNFIFDKNPMQVHFKVLFLEFLRICSSHLQYLRIKYLII